MAGGEAGEVGAQAGQGGDAGVEALEGGGEGGVERRTGSGGGEQRFDVPEREAGAAGGGDRGEARDDGGVVGAAAVAARRRLDQSAALVLADGRGADAGAAGDLGDGEDGHVFLPPCIASHLIPSPCRALRARLSLSRNGRGIGG